MKLSVDESVKLYLARIGRMGGQAVSGDVKREAGRKGGLKRAENLKKKHAQSATN